MVPGFGAVSLVVVMTTLLPLTDDQHESLAAWRSDALNVMPYFASILFALRPVNAPGLQTFAVDKGYRLYIDFDYVAQWTPRLRAEALLHECGHLFGEHARLAEELGLSTPEQRKDWNLAGDAAINDDLRDAGCDELAAMAVLPKTLGADDYLTPHDYYATVAQQRASQPQPQPGDGQGGQPSSSGAPGDQGQPSDEGGNSGGGTPDEDAPFAGCGSGSGGQGAPCELPSDDDLGGEAPAATDAQQHVARIATAQAVRDQIATKGRGSVPGGIAEIAEEVFTVTKTPWRQVLAGMVRRSIASRLGSTDVDRSRRHRRRHQATVLTASGPRRYVVPALVDPTPVVEVIRDTSGSMSADDLRTVGNEIETIVRRVGVRGQQLWVTDVDAGVHEPVPYNKARDIAEIKGRGGTDMSVGIQAAWERTKNRATVVVVLTDGYTPWPAEPGPIPVVAAIVPQGGREVPESVLAAIPTWIKAVAIELD